jgi:hypothetical protein
MSNQLFFNTSINSQTLQSSRLDFTITVSPSDQTRSQKVSNISTVAASSLSDKIREAPSTSLDKLHPKKTDPEPFVEYVDEGLWKSRIVFQKDRTYSVLLSQLQAAKHQAEGKTHENLDALCEAELKRRFPNHQLITGFKASLKNKFPTLARLAMGTDQFYKNLTQKEVNKYKIQIAYSAIDRDDLICQPKIENQNLREQLNLTDDSQLQTEHLFAKNSPLNGQSFVLKGKIVHLSQAIACSNDRKVKNTGNLRVVQSKDKDSICYTGRADSDRKALEQASFIFLNELKTKGKGITRSIDEKGNVVYQLDYVVNSMLSLPWIWSAESAIAPFPEREYLENERKAFLALKEKGIMTIEDPNYPGMKYQVKFNPILFSRSSNIFTRLENWLPPFFTGQSRAEEVSEEGFLNLKTLASKKLQSLQDQLSAQKSQEQKGLIEQKIKRIHDLLQALEKNIKQRDLCPEAEWFIRDYLCKLLDLPIIYHCKSSTDRTSVTAALSSTLKQWIDLGLPIPENSIDLLKNDLLKELFAANWMAGHQITRYARGGKGTVAGQKLNNKNLGLHLSRGIAQNPIVAHLLPERYIQDFSTAKKCKYVAAYLCLLAPLTILFYLPLVCFTAVRHLGYLATGGKNRHWIGPVKFTLPLLPFTLLFNFPNIFPKKVLNENSAQVGSRCLIAGGKHGGKTDND